MSYREEMWSSTTGLVGGAALSNAGVIGYGDDDELIQPTVEATTAGYGSDRGPEGNLRATGDRGFEGHHTQPLDNFDLLNAIEQPRITQRLPALTQRL